MRRQRRNNKGRAGLVAGAAAALLLAVPGSASADVSSSFAGGVLTVNSNAADAITITSVGGQVKVNGGDPGGVVNSAAVTAIDVSGGPGANAINLAGVNATDFPGLASVTVDGGDGNDTINGSQIADGLGGGAGDDRIIGDNNPGGSRDVSRGDAGNDTMVWNPGDGDDVNEGGDGTDTVEVNGGGGGEVFEVKPSATPGRVAFDRTGPNPPGPFNLDIGTSERLDLNANGGDDSLNAAGPAAGLAGWTIDAEGGDGNDTLAGAAEAIDLLSGGAGADTLRSRDQSADTLSGGSEVDSAVVDAQDTVNPDVENVDREQARVEDRLAPAVKLSKKTVAVNRRRVARIRVTSPDEASEVTVALRRRGRLLGRKSIELDGGESKVVKVKLSRRAFALLTDRGRLRVRAIVIAEDEAGNTRRRIVQLTLKAPRPLR